MSQFLVTGQPFENLRLLSEGQYRTEAQSRYEVLSAKNNSFKTRFLNAVAVSAFFVILIADRFLLPPKTVIVTTLILATICTVICPAPAKFPSREERIATQDIFTSVTQFVNSFATAKIEAIQVLLIHAQLDSAEIFEPALAETIQLYDSPDKIFHIPSDHKLIKFHTAQIRTLSEAQEQSRRTSVTVREYAQKILSNQFQIPRQLQGNLETLKQACSRLLNIPDWGLKLRTEWVAGVWTHTIIIKST